jgi:hypothetical protein
MTNAILHFIQENGFTFELGQIETGCGVDDLTRHVEESCGYAALEIGCACVRVRWKGVDLLVWYCANGAEITLRSIVSAYP